MKQRALCGLALWTVVSAGACLGSRGVGNAPPMNDLSGANDLSSAGDLASLLDMVGVVSGVDLTAGGDGGGPCITAMTCQANAAGTAHDCGTATGSGWRYPAQGAPFCTGDMLSYEDCSCELVRCTSSAPLCAGVYQAQFWEQLDHDCSGGGCDTLWNMVRSLTDDSYLMIEPRLSSDLELTFSNEQHAFTVKTPALIQLVVKQYCRFADVAGKDLAGGGEVQRIVVAAQ